VNVIARAAVLAGDGPIELGHLPPAVLEAAGATVGEGGEAGPVEGALLDLPLRQARAGFERIYLEHLLRRVGGNVSEAARRAGMGRASLHEKINKLGIEPDRFRGER
jgi:two-component system response regulator HydG